MADRSIASRPSAEQVMAIVDFMEKHQSLALGQLRGIGGREESKKLWFQLTRTVNNTTGPVRPMKSWIKYWADKKSSVRTKVQSAGGDPNSLSSNIEKKIWDLFLSSDVSKPRKSHIKQEAYYVDSYINEDSTVDNNDESEPILDCEDPAYDVEERQMAVMEKLLKVMSTQAAALSQLGHASLVSSQAVERLADASHLQARALDRLANTFETISGATQQVGSALLDIDATVKRCYNSSPT